MLGRQIPGGVRTGLCLVGVEQDLAVDLEDAQVRVLDALAVPLAAHADLVGAPQCGELFALLKQGIHDLAGARAGSLP